jgi:ABC-type bacteriocin/lantibiotic exporter with double-glycine peptidase domain
MAAISHGKTVITIAHRLSTIRSCDRVVVINKGKITDILTGEDKTKYLIVFECVNKSEKIQRLCCRFFC